MRVLGSATPMLTVTDRRSARRSDERSDERSGDGLAGCGKSSRCLLNDRAAAVFLFADFLRSEWLVPARRFVLFSALLSAAFSALRSAPRTLNVDFSMRRLGASRCSTASFAD